MKPDSLGSFAAQRYRVAMSPDVLEVERALLALAPEERATVIRRGLASLEDSVEEAPADLDAAWTDEFRRRIAEVESGQVRLLSAEEVDEQVRALLAELRR
jgi:putative addiction module component (TIGR02574 family)